MTVPDAKVQILDMIPRVEIIEDLFFRKSIPKSTKLFKFRKNFTDMDQSCVGVNSAKFMKAVVRD